MGGKKSRRILGIDPGYAIAGWGVVDTGTSMKAAAYGALTTDAKLAMPDRLKRIFDGINAVADEFSPGAAVVEKLYFSANKTTAEGVYEARGVILLALASRGIEILELSPVTIKQAVAGSGKASKADVIRMVMRILNINEKISPDDTADALGAAIAGAFHLSSEKMYRLMRPEK